MAADNKDKKNPIELELYRQYEQAVYELWLGGHNLTDDFYSDTDHEEQGPGWILIERAIALMLAYYATKARQPVIDIYCPKCGEFVALARPGTTANCPTCWWPSTNAISLPAKSGCDH